MEIRIIDNKQNRLQIFEDSVTSYSSAQEDIAVVIPKVHAVLKKRYDAKKNGEKMALDKESLECVIINAKEVYEVINGSEELTKQCMEIVDQFSRLKICIVMSDLPNVALQAQTSPFIKSLRTKMNMMIFQQLQDQKVAEIASSVQKKYQKPLVPGEAYFKFGSYFGKYKTPYFEQEKK